MFEQVYTNPAAKGEEYKAEAMVEYLFNYYMGKPDLLGGEYQMLLEKGEKLSVVVADYVAGMTDKYAVSKYMDLVIPKAWGVY